MYEILNEQSTWKKLKYRLKTKLRKFQKSYKKRKFIKYIYPHRKSQSKQKSACIIKNYILKNKYWYKGKKKCLLFYHFEKHSIIYYQNYTKNIKIFDYE